MSSDIRRWIALCESVFYRGLFKQKYSPVEENIVILENPSRTELNRFRSRTTNKKIRGLLENDLLVWDGFIATHSDVAAFFNVDGSDLHLDPDGIVMNDCPDDWTDKEAETAAHWIKTHPAIVRIYGENVTVTLEAPDNGKTWYF